RYQLAADPKLTTSANESIVYPIEGGDFTDKSGKISLKFEDGDTQERLRVSAEVVDSCHQHPSTNRVLREFQLKAEAIDRDNSSVTTFAKPIDLSVAHTLREIAVFAKVVTDELSRDRKSTRLNS